MSCPVDLRLFLLAGILFNIVHIGWNQPLSSGSTTRRLFTMTNKPCEDFIGNVGVCMFKWDCISRNGITLSTCVDGFLFGACCKLKVLTPHATYEASSNVNDIDVGQVTSESQISSFFTSQIYNTKSSDNTLKRIFPTASSTQKSTYLSDFFSMSTSLTSITLQDTGTDDEENFLTVPADLTFSITKLRTEDMIYENKEDNSFVKIRDRNTVTELSKSSAIFSKIKKPYINNNTILSITNLNAYNKNESLLPTFSVNFINITNNSNSDISLFKNELTLYQDMHDHYGSDVKTDASNPDDYIISVGAPVSVELVSKNEILELLSVDTSNDSTIHFTQSNFFATVSTTNEEKKSGTDEDSEDLLLPTSPYSIISDYLDIMVNNSLPSYIQVNLTEERSNALNSSNSTENLLSSTSNITTATVNTSLSDCNDTCSIKTLDGVNNFIDNNTPAKSKMPYTTQKLENVHKLQKPVEILNASYTLSTDYIMLPETSTVNEIESSTPSLETSLSLSENEKPVVNKDLTAEIIPKINSSNVDFSVYNTNITLKSKTSMFQTALDSSDANTSTFNDISFIDEIDDTLLLFSTSKNMHLGQNNNTTNILNEITKEYFNTPDYQTTPTSHTILFSTITSPVNASVRSSTYFEINENDYITKTAQNIFKTVSDKEIINNIDFPLSKFTAIYPGDNQTYIRDIIVKNESLISSVTSELPLDHLTSKSYNQLSLASQEFSPLLATAEHDTKFISTAEMIIDKVQTHTAFINETKPTSPTDLQDNTNNSLDQTTNAQEDNISSSDYTRDSEILIETATFSSKKPTMHSVQYAATYAEGDTSGQNLANISSLVPLNVTRLNYSSLTKLNILPTDEDVPFQQTMYYENISSTHDIASYLITQETSTIYDNSSISSIFNLSTPIIVLHEAMNSTAESMDSVLELSSNIIRNSTNIYTTEQNASTLIVPVANTSSFVTVHNEQIATSPHNVASIYEGLTTVSQFFNDKRDCGVRLLRPFGRIVGGRNTYFGKWPWQALVKEATWLGLFVKNKCGGVLINSKYVVTAAHCQPGFLATLVVILGAHDLSGMLDGKTVARNVRRMVVHRHYNPQTFENDLALLEMESPIDFLPHVVPICLPNRNEDFTGKMAYVTGWGKLTHGGDVPNILQEVQVPIVTNRDCQKMFLHAGHQKAIRSNFICAGYRRGGQDSCEGDSGGPLVVQRDDKRWVLVGTVSHGIGCADANLPGVYMKMSAYRPWIDSIINK